MRTIRQVANGINQIGVIRYQNIYETYYLDALTERSLQYESIWEFASVVILSKRNPLATRTHITERDLLGGTEIIYGDSAIPNLPINLAREIAQSLESKEKPSPSTSGQACSSSSAAIDRAYTLASPMPEDVLERFGLTQRRADIPGNILCDVLIYRSGYRLNRLERFLIEKLRESAKRLFTE